jgi:hypothetical protein
MYKFYSDLTFEESLDHKHVDWSPDNPYTFRQWYEEDIQHRDTLLVTVGDSWTWGDHLGCIDWDKASNDPVRLTQIYGRKLADKLDADWVNLARPGCSNYWMFEQLLDIKKHFVTAREQYKKIVVVITLTEDLREATYTRKFDITRPYRDFWETSNSIREFLITVEGFLFYNIERYFSELDFINVYVSRAFTDSWQENTCKYLLDKTWCDVIQDVVKFNDYQRPVPFIGQMSIDPLNENFITTPEQKIEFLEIMDRVATRWKFLGDSAYNLKGSTCHPNPAGHELWAEYLFRKIR